MKVIMGLFRWLKAHWGFLLIVVVPTLLSAVFLNFIATDRYISESKLVVKRSGVSNEATTMPIVLLGGITNQTEDANYLREYLQSVDVMLQLDKRVGLRKIYTNPEVDYLHRLKDNATQEEFLNHFHAFTSVTLDETTGILTLDTYAFSPVDAQRINRQMVTLAEEYINNISYNIAREQTKYVEKEMAAARKRFDEAQAAIVEFQNRHHLVSPTKQVEQMSEVTKQLESSIVMSEAELKNMLGYMNPEAPQVIALKTKISALKEQLEQEKKLVTGTPENEDDTVLNELTGRYATLEYDLEFATQVYKSTVASMEALRTEIAQKVKNVVLITAPYLPEEPEFPRGIYTTATVFIVLLLVYWAGRLVIATVEDHLD